MGPPQEQWRQRWVNIKMFSLSHFFPHPTPELSVTKSAIIGLILQSLTVLSSVLIVASIRQSPWSGLMGRWRGFCGHARAAKNRYLFLYEYRGSLTASVVSHHENGYIYVYRKE